MFQKTKQILDFQYNHFYYATLLQIVGRGRERMWEAAPQKHSLQQGVIKNVGVKLW